MRPPPYGPKAGATAPGSHASRGAACGRYPETKQGMQSAIMPILWIVQQQLDKAHHITPTTVVKGAVAFPAQGSGGWVRATPEPEPHPASSDPDTNRDANLYPVPNHEPNPNP